MEKRTADFALASASAGVLTLARKKAGERAAGCYQIRQRSVSERTIGDPALHPKAFANDGMFESGPFVRNCPSGCSFVLIIRRANSGR